MDSVEALREAIEIIRNGIDDDTLICDHGFAQEVIAQLEKLLKCGGVATTG
jgi:predicted metal-dependent hydrolase